MDFAVLEFQVTDKLVDKPLLLFFRSLNFTHVQESYEPQLCAHLFIEMEFRPKYAMPKCDSSLPEIESQRVPIHLGANQTHPAEEIVHSLDVTTVKERDLFFYKQDYYVKHDVD